MEASLKAFLAGIIDYAGLFPPADLSLETSLQKYSNYRKSDDSWMLSRYIVPALRLDELEPYGEILFQDGPPYEFSVLGKGTETVSEYCRHLQDIAVALEEFHVTHGNRVTTDILEVKLPREAVFANDPQLLENIYDETLQFLDETPQSPNEVFFEGYFEENWKKEMGLVLETLNAYNRAFEGKNVRQGGVKIRCGGVEADMFPTVEQLAFALNTSRDQKLPIKATAGLHHPIRHYSDSVQTTIHGFFNVFGGAMLSYAHDLSNDKLVEILKEEDPEHFLFFDEGLQWKDLQVSSQAITELREDSLISFGSCSFDEPREDLKQLGLL